jgi:serine/threonine protein kinase
MGPSANSMVEELPCFNPRKRGTKIRYPIWMAKRLLRQALQGLACLHTNNIVHGDFQPGNMLFTLKDLCHVDKQELHQDTNYKWGSISPPVERLDGRKDKWAPDYLAVPQPLAKYADIGKDFNVKLSDFGGGKYTSSLIALFSMNITY